ncbi:MAG: STAS domain-containing protein [Betaproteobacteria bacterium]
MILNAQAYGGAVVLAPAGRLDHENCDAFRATLQPHLERAFAERHGIVFDLSALEYISSGGLRCFMLASNEARNRGGRIVVAAPRPVVAEIFQISRFNLIFDIHARLRDALAAVSPEAAAAFDTR